MLLNEVKHCCLIFHGIVTHCMVLRGIVRYFMALCCIDTIEMILSDWIHSGFWSTSGTNIKIPEKKIY